MAWSAFASNPQTRVGGFTETLAALGNAASVYSSVISSYVGPNSNKATNYVTFTVDPSATPAGNLDFYLCGSQDAAGTVKTRLGAVITTQYTNAGAVHERRSGQVDLNTRPAPYYFIEAVSAGNDAAKTAVLEIYI